MAHIEVDIDIEDYLDECSTNSLIRELNSRGVNILETRTDKHGSRMEEYIFPNFKTQDDVIKFLKKTLGLREFHSNERLLDEVKALF